MTRGMQDRTKGAMWQRECQGQGKYAGVEAEAKPARAGCPCWVGRGDTLVVSWGLQHWAKAKTRSQEPPNLTLTLAIPPNSHLIFLFKR